LSYWNGKAFLRFLYNVFFENRGTNYRLTTKRLGVLLLALLIYLPVELLIWIGLGLDELIYSDYRQLDLPQPVFIIGNPRSGTTFLQRTLAKDEENFHCLRTWEIFGAPSITMRRLMQLIARIGQAIGIPITDRIQRMEQIWKDSDRIHRLRIRAPEEDEYLFIHIFSTMKIWSYAAMEEESDPYIHFDKRLPEKDKNRLMDYYESCIRRHYYYHGSHDKRYLSKNPNFSPAIETLVERFPDAKFIYLVRNPLDAVPSHISLKAREWRLLGSPLEKYSCRDFIIRSSKYWYEYPLKKLRELPADQAIIVRFDELVTNPKRVVEDVYQQLGLRMTDEFSEQLVRETERARNHQSNHHYSLSEMGLKPQQMREEFAEVFEKFDFKEEES
jgi:hypothetical protein